MWKRDHKSNNFLVCKGGESKLLGTAPGEGKIPVDCGISLAVCIFFIDEVLPVTAVEQPVPALLTLFNMRQSLECAGMG